MPHIFSLFSHEQIDRKLRIRLGIFLAIAIVIAAVIAKDVIVGQIAWWFAILGIGIGALIGTLLGRLLTIRWHETEEKAVSEMDVAGAIGIALYIGLELSRNWLLGHWVSGAVLGTFSLAILAGALFGRYLGMRISINRVLERNVPGGV